MEALHDLTQSIASEISSQENRSRKRSADAQHNFEYAIETILKNLWKTGAISTEHECGIQRRSNWYSITPRYRDPNLTFKQTMAGQLLTVKQTEKHLCVLTVHPRHVI